MKFIPLLHVIFVLIVCVAFAERYYTPSYKTYEECFESESKKTHSETLSFIRDTIMGGHACSTTTHFYCKEITKKMQCCCKYL